MLGRRGWVDDYVINECDNKPPQHVAENIIYERLEYRWSISQSIRNDQMLKVSHCGTESDLPLISFPDAHKVVSTLKVQLGEVAGPPLLLDGGDGQMEQIPVLHGRNRKHRVEPEMRTRGFGDGGGVSLFRGFGRGGRVGHVGSSLEPQ